MLVTFSCKAHENVTFFGNVAQALLKLMGHSGTVPGAILANDVPDALARLQQAFAHEQQQGDQSSDDTNGEPDVSLAHRAVPLMALLQNAVKDKCNVMWDKG